MRSTTVASNHFGSHRKFWTRTSSTIENSRSFDLWSCSALLYICLSEILRPRFGRNRSNLVLGRRFRNDSAGIWPVTLFGVVRLLNRNLAKLCVIDELPSVLKCCLNVWTKRSACPFDLGWYGATSMCFIPFCFIKSANSRGVNCGPLSLTNCIGTPYRANIFLSFLIVDSLVTLGIISTSSHLEWLPTTTRNILFTNGPAKSMWILCQGVSGQSHRCSGAICGFFRVNWHLVQSRTTEAIDWSNLGHQTWSRASDFIGTIPGCPSCNSCKTRSRNEPGIITRISHNKQPSSMVSSFRLWYHVWIAGFSSSAHPFIVYSTTLDNTGSARVAFRIWSAVYDKDPICKKFLNLTSSNSSDLLPTGNGNRLKQSAFPCFSVERYSISYWYADNKIAHLCSLAAARVGIPLFGPSNVTKGLWSVTNKNLRPYRYWWNFLIPKIILRASFSICA